MPVDWLRILPAGDYRFHMGLRRGGGPEFFASSPGAASVRALRAALLAKAPEACAVLPEPAPAVLAEAVALLSEWTGQNFPDARAAGEYCEPDWVVLAPDEAGELRVRAGVVCFPSSWSLREKAGLPMSGVHGPAPGLNDSLGWKIDTFLARLTPGDVWLRENWGLSAHAVLDNHPRHGLAPLNAEATLETTWLRLEEQLLTRLPGGGVLFGIRVTTHRLDVLAGIPGVARRLAGALETMEAAVATYKGVTEARTGLVPLLAAATREAVNQ